MSTVLHLPFNDDSGLAGLILDRGPVRFPITRIGAAALSAAQARYGEHSAIFDGSTAALRIPHHERLSLVTGDWTIAFWLWPNSYANAPQLIDKDGVNGQSYPQYNLALTAAGKLTAFLGNGKGVSPIGTSYTGTTTISLGAWHHIALVKTGTLCKGFLDGVQQWSATAAAMYEGSKPLYVGHASGQPDSLRLNGFIDDLLIDNGSALYTGNFTPPDATAYSATPLAATLLNTANNLSVFQTPTQSLSLLPALTGSKDIYYGGNGMLVGTTKNTPAAPVSRRVRLHESRSGHLIREGWSDAAGNYSFTHLSRDYSYYVVGFDHTDQYQGVVADKLVPEAM